MFISRVATLPAILRLITVQAHCDTADGPAVKDGRMALETGNINFALKWIPADGEAEMRDVFDKALKVRTLGPEAAEVADRLFLETMVRIHRMAEGVGFTGIQPAGTQIDPVVTAADQAIALGSDDDLLSMVPSERRTELGPALPCRVGAEGLRRGRRHSCPPLHRGLCQFLHVRRG